MEPDRLTTAVWDVDERAFPGTAPIDERVRFLLRYAVLAPSSHNSQPWSFDVEGPTVRLEAEESRWLEVTDPDRRELHISLGCALENLLVAAARFGLGSRVEYGDGGSKAVATVRIDPTAGPARDDRAELFGAITDRRTHRGEFSGRSIPEGVIARLRDRLDGGLVDLVLVTDAPTKDRIADLQSDADERLLADPAYRRELARWIGNGALGASWVGARIGRLIVTHLDLGRREGARDARRIRGAPAVAVLATPDDTVESRVRTGQAFERLTLASTSEGLGVHPMSQVLEVDDLKADLADCVGLAEAIPQHVFRVGYPEGDVPEHTPRFPLTSVLGQPGSAGA